MIFIILILCAGDWTVDITAQMRSAVVIIPMGTGFFIDQDTVVTSRHVLSIKNNKIAPPIVTTEDGVNYKSVIYADDPDSELVILKVKGKVQSHGILKLSTDPPIQGQKILIMGHPLGYNYTVTHGIVSAVNRKIELPNGKMLNKTIQIDGVVNKGNSGGPVVNKKGEVIGIIVALEKNLSFAINVTHLTRTLEWAADK